MPERSLVAVTAIVIAAVLTPSGFTRAQTGPGLPIRDPRGAQASKADTSIIRGRVTRAGTAQPIRRVEVVAQGAGFAGSTTLLPSTVTDSDGRYQLSGLPGGHYTVRAVRGEFVRLSYGQRHPFDAVETIDVAPGQVVDGIDFELSPAAAISGEVLDEYGEPLVGAVVQAFRFGYRHGLAVPEPVGTVANPTDDLGQFRISGLPPGEYYVSTRPTDLLRGPADTHFLPTYYPGTSSVADARPLTVREGEQIAGISIFTSAVRPAAVSGTVVSPDGQPVGGATVSRQLKLIGGFASGTIESRPDGRFVFPNLAPGQYTIGADISGPNGTQRAYVDLTVAGTDIAGLLLMPRPDIAVRGRVMLEAGTTPSALHPSHVRIRGEAPDDPERHISLAPTLRDDWSFEGRVTAGLSWLLRVTTPAGWTTKSVRVRSRDITDQPVTLTADLNDVEIVLTDRVTTVSGTVFDAGGMAATSATVVIMADDPQKWGPHSRFIRRVRTNASGRFTVQGLPAGRYIGVALQYLPDGDEGNPELLTRLRPLGQALLLDDAGSRAVSLIVSPHP